MTDLVFYVAFTAKWFDLPPDVLKRLEAVPCSRCRANALATTSMLQRTTAMAEESGRKLRIVCSDCASVPSDRTGIRASVVDPLAGRALDRLESERN